MVIREWLIKLKEHLIQISMEDCYMDNYDEEQIDYLIGLIDGFLTGTYSLNYDTLEIFLGDIVSTAVMLVRFELLDYVKPFRSEYAEV